MIPAIATLEPLQPDSPAMQFLTVLWHHSLKATGHSWTRLNAGMREALHVAIRTGLAFDIEDFNRLADVFRWQYWAGQDNEKNFGEQFYTAAIAAGNASAWRSFEHRKGRKPFIVKGKRLHLRAEVAWEGLQTLATSFDDSAGTVTLCAYAKVNVWERDGATFASGDGKPTRIFTVTHAQLRAAFPSKHPTGKAGQRRTKERLDTTVPHL